MIDLKSISIDHERAIGVKMNLPLCPIHLILTTRGFICGDVFNQLYFDEHAICACIMESSLNFDMLLNSHVKNCSKRALERGIVTGMSGKMALLKMYEISVKD